jgi:hypothetical protein
MAILRRHINLQSTALQLYSFTIYNLQLYHYLNYQIIFLLIYKMQAQFQQAAFSELQKANESDYVNARYAPVGNQALGTPFPLFRQSGAYFTDWTPAGQTSSNTRLQMNLPTNNTLFRNTQQSDAVNLANKQNTSFVFRTQTLANNGDPIACRNNADCSAWHGTTCNSQYMSWPDAKGNQGNFCSLTKYPEIESGHYMRKNTTQGGIGKACTTDNECGSGYKCNNLTDMFGKNVQQTGYCAQSYSCPDGNHFLGYPYNSGIPIVPPPYQNNGGRGYSSEDECKIHKLAQQDCKQDMSDNWFATYPGYCPVLTNLRGGNHPAGMLPSSDIMAQDKGIVVPAYATNASSSTGKPLPGFSAWNINSNPVAAMQMGDPLAYELAINPK